MLPHSNKQAYYYRDDQFRDPPTVYIRRSHDKKNQRPYAKLTILNVRVHTKVGKCCRKTILTVECKICGIDLRFDGDKFPSEKKIVHAIESIHKHYPPEIGPLILSTGESYLCASDSIPKVQKTVFANCNICGDAVVDMWYLADGVKKYKYEKDYEIVQALQHRFRDHLRGCKKVKELRIQSINMTTQDKMELSVAISDKIREMISANKTSTMTAKEERMTFYDDNKKFDKEFISLLFDVDRCECGDAFIYTCAICGNKRKNNNYAWEEYNRIVRHHLRYAPTGTHTDIIAPINPKINGICTCANEEEKGDKFHGYGDDNADNDCEFYLSYEGFKCAICGVEYETETGKKPPRDVVIEHVKTCLAENREFYSKNGYSCCD